MTKATRRSLLQGAAALAGTAFLPGALAQVVPIQPGPVQGGPVTMPPMPQAQPVPASPMALPGAGFLQTGVRLTYLRADAGLAIPIGSLVPDANGRWKDARSGEVTGNGNSGAGFLAVDVLGLSAAGILCWDTLFGLTDPEKGSTVIADSFGAVVPGAGFRDAWLPPAELAALKPRETPDSKIFLEDIEAAGRIFKTVNVQTFGDGGWTQTLYDLETGLVVSSGIATPIPQGTNLQITRLLGIRTPTLPGPEASYPEDIARLKSIVYAGDYGTVVTGASAVPPFPLEARYEVTASNPSYLVTKLKVTLNGQSTGDSDLLMPAGMLGSFWVDPRWLAARTTGEMLDADPITGATVKCAGVYGGLMVLGITTAVSTRYLGYDPQTGALKAIEGSDVSGPGTITRRLYLKSAA